MSDPLPEPESQQDSLERRLATILAADVAGYSRLMEQNEEATVQTLRSHRSVFDALLKQHHGILAEFPSTVEAVRCATEIQSALGTRNEHLPPEERMLFRMGINLGDVVVQGGDLLGDGVNVAARIQALAEPGGICISGSVYDQIQNKLSLQFQRLGDKNLKNIANPVRTFSITQSDAGALPMIRRASPVSRTALAVGAVVAILIAGGGYALWRTSESRRVEQETLAAQLAAEKKAAEEARQKADELTRRASQAEEKAERERIAAEAAKREAELKTQAERSDEARRRAEEQGKRLSDENQKLAAKAASEEARATAAAARAEAKKGRSAPDQAATAVPVGTASTAVPKTGARGPFDGAYEGKLCNAPLDASKRRICWPVALVLENGTATGTWTNRALGKQSSMRVNARPDSTVTATLDAWKLSDGTPLTGSMTGKIADNRLDLDGRWANGLHIEGHWAKAP